MAKKRRRSAAAQTIGGMVVGFDYQVFRSTPPPHELVQKGRPVTGVSGEDGTRLQVTFPDAEALTEPGVDAHRRAATGTGAADPPDEDAPAD